MQSIHRVLLLITFIFAAVAAFAQTRLISPVAGNGVAGFSGDGGPATAAELNSPAEVAVGPNASFYIADQANERIRKVNGAGVISTVAGNGDAGWFFATGPALTASLDRPSGVAVDASGNIYIVESLETGVSRVHRVDGQTGTISPVPIPVGLNGAVAIALDPGGSLYISEEQGNRIDKVDPITGALTVIAGTGAPGFSGDGGPATSATFDHPINLAFDGAGNLYVADSFNNRIRKIAAGSGIITTVAGFTLAPGFSGDGGPATNAQLNRPQGVSVDAAGDIFIADTLNQRIRRVTAKDGRISTIVSADGCAAITSSLQSPESVAIDASGQFLYIVDQNGNRIWEITLDINSPAPTLASISPANGVLGAAVNVTLTGTGFFGNASGSSNAACRVSGTTVFVSGAGITATNVNATSDTSLGATFIIAPNADLGPHNVTVTTDSGTTSAVQFTIAVPRAPAPTLTSISPGNITQGAAGPFTLTGTNFDTTPGGTTVTVDGTGIVITNVNVASANSLTATFTASGNAGLGVHNVTVSTSGGASNPAQVTVQPGTPSFVYNMPQTLNPTDQTAVQVALSSAFSNPVTGTLAVTFTPNAINPADDPNVTIVNSETSSRTTAITFPANAVTANLAMSSGVLQAGTVAGDIQLSITNVQIGGAAVSPGDSTFDIQVPQGPPVITSISVLNRTSGGFNVAITGYSTTRSITAATFEFGAASGQKLLTTELQPGVTSPFTTYYQSPASDPTGSAFVYTQPFSITQGTVNAVASVTVTLTNSAGTSQPASAPIQ